MAERPSDLYHTKRKRNVRRREQYVRYDEKRKTKRTEAADLEGEWIKKDRQRER